MRLKDLVLPRRPGNGKAENIASDHTGTRKLSRGSDRGGSSPGSRCRRRVLGVLVRTGAGSVQAALKSPGFPTRPARGPVQLLRCCRRRRLCCWGWVRGGAEKDPALADSLAVFVPEGPPFSVTPRVLRCRGQSLGTPRHAADMPLFATNPFDQDVGKCFHRPRWVPHGTASPRRPPTPCVRSFWIPKAELTFFSPGAPSFRVGRGLSVWRILFERNGT